MYFQTGILSQAPAKGRGTQADVVLLPSIHCDVDILNPEAHKSTDLPRVVEEAETIIAAIPLPPTLVIHSGNGLQAYWCFDAPYRITDDLARQRVKSLCVNLQSIMQVFAKSKG